MTNFKKIAKRYWVSWVLVVLVAVNFGLRLHYVANHNFPFWYDQARDGVHVSEILSGDLKLIGPSASGTRDSVYHGVLFYYFLTPFYALNKDPQLAMTGLALLASLSLVIVFWLAKEILRSSKLALIPVAMTAFSVTHFTLNAWLSNPSLNCVFLPLYWLCLWFFWQKAETKWALLAAMAGGLVVQAGFYGIYWLGLLGVIFWCHGHRKRLTGKSWWLALLGSGGVFLAVTATMVVTEILMIQRGILNWETLASFGGGGAKFAWKRLMEVGQLMSDRIGFSLVPDFSALGVVALAGLLGVWVWKRRKVSERAAFCGLVLGWPVVFLLIYFRASPHIVANLEVMIYIGLTLAIMSVGRYFYLRKWEWWVIGIAGGLVFGLSNLMTLERIRVTNPDYYGYMGTSILREQLALIDHTYRVAQGRPFSISARTNPYGINVTWNYLYWWYGQEKYGYLPEFFGPSQEGIVGGELLRAASRPLPVHFAIYEVAADLPPQFVAAFAAEQMAYSGTESARMSFGSALELTSTVK
jgi:hypothetical protein